MFIVALFLIAKSNSHVYQLVNGKTKNMIYIYTHTHTLCLVTQSYLTLCNPMDCSPPGSSDHGDSLGKNTEVGCHALLQGIFPTQGSNPGLPHCRCSLPFEPLGKPQNLITVQSEGTKFLSVSFIHCDSIHPWPFRHSLIFPYSFGCLVPISPVILQVSDFIELVL